VRWRGARLVADFRSGSIAARWHRDGRSLAASIHAEGEKRIYELRFGRLRSKLVFTTERALSERVIFPVPNPIQRSRMPACGIRTRGKDVYETRLHAYSGKRSIGARIETRDVLSSRMTRD